MQSGANDRRLVQGMDLNYGYRSRREEPGVYIYILGLNSLVNQSFVAFLPSLCNALLYPCIRGALGLASPYSSSAFWICRPDYLDGQQSRQEGLQCFELRR